MTTNTTRYTLDSVSAGDTIRYGDITQSPSAHYQQSQPITLIDYASYSDYSGGAVERSNYRVLLADPEIAPHLVRVIGAHDSTGLAYLGTAEDPPEFLNETLAALESYAVLDESDESELEMELENEAWADWGRKDFARALVKMFDTLWPDHETSVDLVDEYEQIFAVWRAGCDGLNVNGGSGYQIEMGGTVYFYITEWIEKFERYYLSGSTPKYFSEWPSFMRDVEALSRLGMSSDERTDV